MVGLAGGIKQEAQALIHQLIVLFAAAPAMVDTADAELEFFAEEAHAHIQIDGVFGLDGLIEPRDADTSLDAGGYAVVVHVVGEREVFVAGFLF